MTHNIANRMQDSLKSLNKTYRADPDMAYRHEHYMRFFKLTPRLPGNSCKSRSRRQNTWNGLATVLLSMHFYWLEANRL